MCEHNLQRFRVRIRRRENVVTVHAEEEMVEGGLSVLDLESAVLNGEILERHRDPVTREWKYVVRDRSRWHQRGCRWKVELYGPSRYNHRLQGLAMTVRKSIICDNCGKKGAREHRVTRTYCRGRNLLVIERAL